MNDFQHPFKIAAIIVDPLKDQITCSGETVKVQSMAMKVLCYFASNEGQLISRDDLRENVWKNPTTSDHTINNHIYGLRRTIAKLAPDTKFIHTVTGSNGNGYRLLFPVEPLSSEAAGSVSTPVDKGIEFNKPGTQQFPPNTQDDSRAELELSSALTFNKLTSYSVLAVAVVAFCIGIVIWWLITEENYHRVTYLTNEVGREQSPAISRDGSFIIYAHRNKSVPEHAKWELYAKRLNGEKNTQKVFSDKFTNDNFVSISPNNQYISFIRYKTGDKGIYIADFDNATLTAKNARLLIKLNEINTTTAISWLSNSKFYYSAREAIGAPMRVYLYDMASNLSEQVTSPPIDSYGDMTLVVSPDKSLLAIMRATGEIGYQLFLYDVVKNDLLTTPIQSTENRLHISFSDDSRAIYYVDEQGYLSQFNIMQGTSQKLSDQQHLGYWPLKVPGKQQFIMQQEWGLSSLTTQIVKFSNPLRGGSGKSSVVVNNSLSIRSIAGIEQDGLVFASVKPNHHVELWRYQHGQADKLPDFDAKPNYRYPLSIHWKINSNKALLSINKTCLLIDVQTGKSTPLCPANENVYAGRFSLDGQSIFLPGTRQGTMAAVKMGVTGYPIEKLHQMANANSIVQTTVNDFYYSVHPNFDIYHYDVQNKQQTKLIERTYLHNEFSVNDFVVTERGIYYMDRVAVTNNAVYFYEFATKKTHYVIKSKDNYPNIVLSADEGYIYLIESVDSDSKLLLVE